jgi:hypothetical protein
MIAFQFSHVVSSITPLNMQWNENKFNQFYASTVAIITTEAFVSSLHTIGMTSVGQYRKNEQFLA